VIIASAILILLLYCVSDNYLIKFVMKLMDKEP